MTTREAFGKAIAAIGNDPTIIVLDGDVKNSTYTYLFEEKFPERFIQCFIAEQTMVGVAVGLAKQGFAPWVTTFSAFMTRAHDQIRMAALSDVSIRFVGSHAGVAIGADGPSQMGLEDISLFRSIQGSTVLSPCDGAQTMTLVSQMQKTKGIVYMRTMRDATPDIYSEKDKFEIGGSKTFGDGTVTVIGTGVTVHEALAAQKEMPGIRVIDCYSIKPIDEKTLKDAAKKSKAIIVVEDHYPEGGLGEAVLSVLGPETTPVIHLSVAKRPRSGTPKELLAYEGIDAQSIIAVAKKYV